MFRKLYMIGYTKVEAGNMVAEMLGLKAVESGWTIKQIMQLLFVKQLKIEP